MRDAACKVPLGLGRYALLSSGDQIWRSKSFFRRWGHLSFSQLSITPAYFHPSKWHSLDYQRHYPMLVPIPHSSASYNYNTEFIPAYGLYHVIGSFSSNLAPKIPSPRPWILQGYKLLLQRLRPPFAPTHLLRGFNGL